MWKVLKSYKSIVPIQLKPIGFNNSAACVTAIQGHLPLVLYIAQLLLLTLSCKQIM